MSELSPRTWAREPLRFSQAGGTTGFPWREEWPLVHAAASGRAARGRVGSVCGLAGEPESAVPLGDRSNQKIMGTCYKNHKVLHIQV